MEMGTVELRIGVLIGWSPGVGMRSRQKTKEMRCEKKEVTGWAAGKMKEVRLGEWTLDVMR